jgi:hypothetical protein
MLKASIYCSDRKASSEIGVATRAKRCGGPTCRASALTARKSSRSYRPVLCVHRCRNATAAISSLFHPLSRTAQYHGAQHLRHSVATALARRQGHADRRCGACGQPECWAGRVAGAGGCDASGEAVVRLSGLRNGVRVLRASAEAARLSAL